MKKFTKVASVVALAATLTACGKTKTVEKKVEWTEEEKIQWAEENGYTKEEAAKPLLEVTFNNYKDVAGTEADEQTRNLTAISYADLATKFEADYDFILMLGNSECGTCATLKSVLADWIADTKYTVYYISDETAGTEAEKTAVMNLIGNPTTWPKLYAVVGGEVVETKGFANSTEVTRAKVDEFAAKHFQMEEFKATTYRFENLAEYRAAVASGEQFIVYVGRDACPDCKNLSDIKKDDSLRKYFTEYTGKIYQIVSEDTIAEHANSTLWNDATKWNGYWGTIDVANNKSKVSGNNQAENLAYMIAGGVFTPAQLALGQEEFLQAAITYADNAYLHDDGTNYMRDSIRSVPGLAAVNFAHGVEYAKATDSVFALIADNAEMTTMEYKGETYKAVKQTKKVQVYEGNAWVEKEVTYTKLAVKALNLGSNAGVEGKNSPFTGDNGVALWITHKNAFVGALGGKGAATMASYTNNMTFSNIYTDCLTSRNPNYHTVYELDMVQAQTMNWMTSWVYDAE
jgi:hypothetical protein